MRVRAVIATTQTYGSAPALSPDALADLAHQLRTRGTHTVCWRSHYHRQHVGHVIGSTAAVIATPSDACPRLTAEMELRPVWLDSEKLRELIDGGNLYALGQAAIISEAIHSTIKTITRARLLHVGLWDGPIAAHAYPVEIAE